VDEVQAETKARVGWVSTLPQTVLNIIWLDQCSIMRWLAQHAMVAISIVCFGVHSLFCSNMYARVVLCGRSRREHVLWLLFCATRILRESCLL
jgi:hypothetical protein